MHSSTQRKVCREAFYDTASLTRVLPGRGSECFSSIAEGCESPSSSCRRVLRRHVCATLPRAYSPGARDYSAGVELAAVCSFAERREGLDAAHASDGSAFRGPRQLQYGAEHFWRCALSGLANAAVSQRSQAGCRRLLRG